MPKPDPVPSRAARCLPRWLAALTLAGASPAIARELPQLEITSQDRVLVVAPHPDDETLCCAGVLQRAAAVGAEVGIVWMTAGDGARFNALLARVTPWSTGRQMVRLGKRRLREAAAAAGVLGVPETTLWILGYPDRGLARLLDPASDQPFRSAYTRRADIPYVEAVSASSTITAAGLHADLVQVIREFRPSWVIAPAVEDAHPDHRATGELVRQALATSGAKARLAGYIVHAGRQLPARRGFRPHLALEAASAAGGNLHALELTAEERHRKAEALRQHRSQMRRMARFLKSFVRRDELFVVDLPDAAGAATEEG
ncbi:MAG: PIG-L family deacetylase [Pseudomonadota bacterium]|jgi:LmbE family N-acetylglucosaminyl deacetylase|nr:MAG: hypothetical protein DIU62_08340 [Pseudomonadota bacterium]